MSSQNQKYLELDSATRRAVKKVSIVSMSLNALLVIGGFIIGGIFVNMSVISDAAHTFADIGVGALVLLAVIISKPTADKNHNYGHEKREPLILLFFALALMGLAGYLAYSGIVGIISPNVRQGGFNAEWWLLAGIVIASLIVKEAMFWYQIYYAKKHKSQLLKANAWHSRSDSISSAGVLAGLITSVFIGNDLVESIAVLLVAVLIIWIAGKILYKAVGGLTDKAVDEKTYNELMEIIKKVEGVKSVDKLQTRQFGGAIFVDTEIAVDADLSVCQGHDIAETVHDTLEALSEPSVKHVLVHVNPYRVNEAENLIEN